MSWLEELFKVRKPIIACATLERLPGDPGYSYGDAFLAGSGSACFPE